MRGPSFTGRHVHQEDELGGEKDTPTIDLIRRVQGKMKNRTPPAEVTSDDAPIYENTLLGDEIDLDLLPIPKHWPLDGGRYGGTGDAVITRDPDTGYLNIGTYRMMQQGKRQVGTGYNFLWIGII